ncbi:lachesin-like [Leptopilina heterotoma]|uniref:lachesin-like n=1 Tax=Leptopilina heterotoma TaxID=63436 RepID=UPI001CAA27BA|nr:lachesin-like [Leptopilina heterotoma]
MTLLAFLTLSLFLLLQTVTCQLKPSISYISQEQTKDIGSTVELQCSVQNATDYSILWVKKGSTYSLPLSTGTTLIVLDSRFSLRYHQRSSTYVLKIEDVQKKDAGLYECQIVATIFNVITADVELHVRRPPVINDNSTRSLVVSEGQTVQLECYADGYPTPRIFWRRENNVDLPTGGTVYHGNILKIASVCKEDRGTYYCVAENGVRPESKRNLNVEVEFAPVITATRPFLGQALQYDIELKCHIEAYPPPAIVWIKNNVQLSNNQNFKISHFATADEYTDTTLRVKNIEKHHFGDYFCKASNKLGSAETKVELFETISPVCPPACGQVDEKKEGEKNETTSKNENI